MIGRGAAILALAACAWATVAHAETRVSRDVLPNGMRIVVRESRAARIVAVSLQVDAAHDPERDDEAGITNFLHRAVVRGTTRRSAVEIAESAERLGGSIEGSGDVDHGEIRGQALSRSWERLLALVAEVALEPALDAGEIDRERRLILGQIRSRDDMPSSFAMDTMLAELYGRHPYAIPTLGRQASVERITRDALVARYRRLYRPDRLVLAVSGDVERARVARLAARLFGRLPARTPRDAAGDTAEPPRPSAVRAVVSRAAQQAQVLVGYVGPAIRDADYPTTSVLAAILGGGISSRLFADVRERRALAYSVGAIARGRRGPGFVIAYLRTAPATVADAETAMREQIERLTVEPPTEEEVARARAHVIGAQALDRRTNARYAWYLAFYEMIGVGWDFPERHADAVARVTPAEVMAAARRYLTAPTTVVVLPPR